MLSALALLTCLAVSDAPKANSDQFFELKVRPVLADTCFKCHGGEKTSGGLRIDSRESLLRGGDTGPAIVPGKPDESLLIRAIRHTDPDIQMPPQGKVPDEVVVNISRWVQDGANWPDSGKSIAKPLPAAVKSHWAFQPVRAVQPPADPTAWSKNPIDRFIVAKRLEKGLLPVGEADKRTLLRRAYFDLIGLPPTPEDISAFMTDKSPAAWETIVEKLLASPRYGERWGRHYLDTAHYADTSGDNSDYPVPEAHLYRDYVIDSFNADKPYDQFVREQLAGDILAQKAPPEKYAELITATGYLALARRYGTAPYEFWPLSMEDMIDTVGQSLMGLTVRCARCHDHKFDPITMRDYYGMYGIFASTQFPWAGGEEFATKDTPRLHFVPLLAPAEAAPRWHAFEQRLKTMQAELSKKEEADPRWKKVAAINDRIEVVNKKLDEIKKTGKVVPAALNAEIEKIANDRNNMKEEIDKKFEPLSSDLAHLKQSSLPPDVPGAYAVTEGTPQNVPIQLHGVAESPGQVVPRGGAPAFLTDVKPLRIPAGESGRLEFAQWLTKPENPLTARVMVNRIWQHHFGKGLVGTPNNFGMRGAPPSHPELLDYLAGRFIESGWSIKAMHRLILTSRTWQLASTADAADAARDPGNAYYWRFDRNRLDAEAIRDAMLSISGELDLLRPGGHPFPPLYKWGFTQATPFKSIYPSTTHRTVYLMTGRSQRHPFLSLFDGADTNASIGQRTSATVPLQALYLMNSPEMGQHAAAFAHRLIGLTSDREQRIREAFELVYCREPLEGELARAVHYVDDYEAKLAKHDPPFDATKPHTPEEKAQNQAAADARELAAWTSYAQILLMTNEFFYVD